MKTSFSFAVLCLALAGLVQAEPPQLPPVQPEARLVVQAQVTGIITGITTDHLQRVLDHARDRRAALVLLEMDTPGGAVSATEDIIQKILGSRVPVVVLVTPSGAQAASAGLYIANAADLIAMSPGTRIGAGHPVTISGGTPGGDPNGRNYLNEKIENDLAAGVRSIATQRGRNAEAYERMVRESVSYTEREALEQKIIDLVARDREDLLAQIDGREVARFDGTRETLATHPALLDPVEMTRRERIFSWIARPEVASILVAIGLLGLYVEFNNPGLVVPGAVGALALILFALSIQILPINILGLLLIALAVALFVLEVKFTSFGLLTLAGVVALSLGFLTLFDTEELPDIRVPIEFVIPTSVTVGAAMLAITTVVVRAHRSRVATGQEGLVGEVGTAITDLGAAPGKVFVHGEYWDATSGVAIRKGEKVKVKEVRHLGLDVEPNDTEGRPSWRT